MSPHAAAANVLRVVSSAPVRIVLLDDEGEIRDALIELLQAEPTFEVVGSAALAEDGIRLIAEERPDVALVDVRIEGGEGSRATREALESSPETRVVGLSAISDRDTVLGMFRAGAIGFVDKGSPSQVLLDAVHSAMEGRPVISPEISGEVVVELAGRLRAEDAEEQDSRSRRSRIEDVLHDRDAMHVVFQPIYEISSNTLVGFEALMRFLAEPRRPPNEWFAEAAGVGLGSALEAEAVRRAIRQLPELPGNTYLSVNVSPETLPTVGLQAVLEDVPLDRLVVELTEHAIVRDYGTLGHALGDLRRRGLRLAVDDAGAGYASLRHIVRLAPDIIKLDAGLVGGIQHDATRRALAAALISFATETEEAIVAEGVETVGELDVLQALGVPFGQGFLLGRPASLSAHARAGRPSPRKRREPAAR
jgi:EAL domain-containing protein (putative c-di-GMP-specific phosphodiesterase class I)/FixJ family two-component response regulator